MQVYAGIDEAGYGPMFGPLLVARAVFVLPDQPPPAAPSADAPLPDLWDLLADAVCRQISRRQGRIPINDSKKLHSTTQGIAHLERGVLAFAALSGRRPADVGQLLDQLGETSHHDLTELPWYQVNDDSPWRPLPSACTDGESAVARALLATAARKANVQTPDLGASVVFESRFNRMVAATRSKASTSFTFVAGHLQEIWRRFGADCPTVVVDRQSGRTRYRELLSQSFTKVSMRVLAENPTCSAYHLTTPTRKMTVRFEVDADARHMPVALASMIAKYGRELLMQRFNHYFTARAPQIKPTAGYATDGRRFWNELQPHLAQLNVDVANLRRIR